MSLLLVTPHDGHDVVPPWRGIHSQDAMGRTVTWALELMDQGITYASRMMIKSQVLADFIVEWTEV